MLALLSIFFFFFLVGISNTAPFQSYNLHILKVTIFSEGVIVYLFY